MSEFSDSFHLRATDPAQAIELLRRAKAPGYVFPAEGGFVTFVCPREDGLHRAILAANPGLLIDYSFAEDHGCWVDVYERDVEVAKLFFDFDERRARLDRTKLIALGLLDARAAEDIARWIRGSAPRGGDEHHLVARKLRLPHFSWLSYHYAQSDEAPPDGRIEVQRNGEVRTLEEAAMDEIEELCATLPPTRKPASAQAAPKTSPAKKARPARRTKPKSRRA